MKYFLVIGDGMADTELPQLGGKTPLEALELKSFDRVAGCISGRVQTIPEGLPAGSDTAILSIFGCDPRVYYTGRSVLEAAGMDIDIKDGDISFRVNLCSVEETSAKEWTIHSHNGGNIHGQEALTLVHTLVDDPAFSAKLKELNMTIHPTDTFRHIGVMSADIPDLAKVVFTEPHNILGKNISSFLPHLSGETSDKKAIELASKITELMSLSYNILNNHPINENRRAKGQLPANMVWPWGAATAISLPSFVEKYQHKGSVITAVPLVWGIANLVGLKTPKVEGANGDLDTNYEGKVAKALSCIDDGDDFVAVHIEAPDEMSHAGNFEGKIEAIKNVESRVVAPLIEGMLERKEDFRLLLLSDHPTFLTTRSHDGGPVPYAIYDSEIEREYFEKEGKLPSFKFCERSVKDAYVIPDGTDLMPLLFKQITIEK